MHRIDWYIFKKFLGTFFYAISLLIIVVIIFDLSENIELFLKNNASLREVVVDYYLNFIPYFINLFIYLFTFISVIFFTSKMAGNTEIIAILSSGISFWRLMKPYLLAALLLGIMSLYLGNFLIPRTNEIRREFKDAYMENLDKSKELNIHIQIRKGVFAYVETYNHLKNIGYKFSLETFEEGRLKSKLMADRVSWDSLQQSWLLTNYFERHIINDSTETLVTGKTIDTVIELQPSDLYQVKEDFEIMNYFELRDKINREKLKGSSSVTQYQIEMNKRLAAPAAILVLTVIGVALSSRKVRGGIGMHLGMGIAITFSYILFMQISTVFATNGSLSPTLAAWLPNILFSIIGIYLLLKAPK